MNKQKFLLILLTLVVTGFMFADPPQWTPITGNQYNMQLYAEVTLYDLPFENDPDNIIAAFGPGGESDCRSIGFWDEIGSYAMWYFTIRSNASANDMETIDFMIYDAQSDQVYECLGEFQIYFEDNSIIGSIYDPYQLTAPVNYPPVANDDFYSVNEDLPLNIDTEDGVLENDSDFNQDTMTAILIDSTIHGSVNLNDDGSFSYQPFENYNGEDNFSYKAFDGEFYSELAYVYITVNPVNDPPFVENPIEDFQFDEGETDTHINLYYVFEDVDGDLLNFFVNQDVNLEFSIDFVGNVTISSLDENWFGEETVVFSAQDNEYAAYDTVTITVNPVNDPPEVFFLLPDLELLEDFEDQITDLDNHFTDIDGDDLQYSAVYDYNHVTIAIDDNVMTISSLSNWFGVTEVTVTAQDDYGRLTISDTFQITVIAENDPPVLLVDLPDTYMNEDDSVITRDLNYYFVDYDNDPLDFSVEFDSTALDVWIDSDMLYFEPMENWNGTSTVTVTAADLFNDVSDSFDVIVSAVADPPYVYLEIPDFILEEGFTAFDINLYDHFADVDSDSLQFSASITETDVITVDIIDEIMTISSLPQGNGIIDVTVTAQDDFNRLTVSDIFTVEVIAVNDPPELVSPIDDQNVLEDFLPFELELSTHFNDPDDDPLFYSVSFDESEIDLSLDGSVITISSVFNWFGTSQVTVSASDEMPLNAPAVDHFDIIVQPVNDPPFVEVPIDDQYVQEDFEPIMIELNDHFVDYDDVLSFDVEFDIELIEASIDQGILTISSRPDKYGDTEVSVTASDDNRVTVSDDFWVYIAPVNDEPVITLPDTFEFFEDTPLTVDFSQYISDVDSETLLLEAEGNINVLIDIDQLTVTFTNIENWNGSEAVTFNVSDEEYTVSDEVQVIVIPQPDDLSLNLPDNFNFLEDEFLVVDLFPYIINPDNLELELSCEDTEWISVSIDNFQVTFEALPDWYGYELLTFHINNLNGSESASDSVEIVVIPVNDTPIVIQEIPDFVVDQNFDEFSLDLNEYFFDVDNDVLSYSAVLDDSNSVIVNIYDNILTITSIPYWFGIVNVNVTADDQMGLLAYDSFSIEVIQINQPPFIENPIEDFLVMEDFDTFTLDLDDYFTDPDNDTLSYSVSFNLNQINIDLAGNILTVHPVENWYGDANVIVSATDEIIGHNPVEEQFQIQIQPVNDPPIIVLPNQFVFVPNETYNYSFANYISDIDSDFLFLTFEGNQNIDIDVNNLIVTFTTNDWIGDELVTFYVSDGELFNSDDILLRVVTSAMPPVIQLPNTFTLEEDTSLIIDFEAEGYVYDNDSPVITLQAEGVNIDVNIQGLIVEFIPEPNWFGSENILFTVSDELFEVTDSVDVIVNPVNDPPQFQLPLEGFHFEEDSNLVVDFGNYISDPENDQITQLTSSLTNNLIIDITGLVVQFSAMPDWNGIEYVTFEAIDQFSAIASDSVLVTVVPVNDPPQIEITYSQITMQEDSQRVLDLASFISDIDNDNDELTLAVFDNDNIEVAVDGFSVTLIPDQDWFGSEVLNFVVSDNVTRLQDNDFVEIIVEPINDAPIIDIPQDNYYFNEDEYLILDISDYITDVDDVDLDIQYMGNTYLNFQVVSPSVFNISAPENWFGSELITFTVSDSAGLTDSDQVTINVVSVPDNPVINLPDNFVLDEDSSLIIDFEAEGYVYDIDSDSLFLYAQSSNIIINISGLVVELIPLPDWNGSEIVTFTILDESSMSDDDFVEIIVNPINDPPSMDIQDSFIVHEDESLQVDFSQFIYDVDQDDITLSVSDNQNVLVDIQQLIVTFSAVPDWNGSEILTFTANDNQGRAIATDTTEVFVVPANDPPVINLPETIVMNEDVGLQVNFAQYISDDSDSLWLSVTGDQNISVDIEQLNVSFIPDYNWNGSEVMTFSVYDGEFTVSDIVNIIVIPVNDPPQINLPPEFVFNPNQNYNINFANYTFDHDGDQLTLSYSGNQNITIDIDDLMVTFTTNDWLGVERLRFFVEDSIGASTYDDVDIVVSDDTQVPVIYLPESFTFNEDGALNVDFNQFIYNENNFDVYLSVDGNENVLVEIDTLSNLVVLSSILNWNGSENVEFTIYTPSLEYYCSDVTTVIVNPINDPPVINLPVEGFSFLEDGSLTVNFNLGSGYISDVDSDSVFINLDANAQYPDIDLTFIDNIATFTTVEQDWWGSEDFTISVNDGLIYLEEVFTVNVIPVNDTPSINLPEEGFSFPENSVLPVDFSQYIEDIDEDELLIMLVNETDFVYAEINQTMVTFSAFNYWNGTEALVFSVNDLQGRAIDIDTVMVFVNPVNNPPYVETPIPDIEIMENSYDESIDLNQVFADYDLDPLLNETVTDSLIFSYLEPGDNNFNISINNGIVSIAPFQNWYGQKTILFYAIDTGGLEVADSTLITVISVNYPPEVVQDIPDYEKLEDFADFTLDLDDYFFDQDADILQYSIQFDPAQVNAQIVNSILTISSLENWFGQAGLIAIATDPDSLSATEGFVVNVAPVNDPPQITLPDHFDLTEDIVFSVNFDEYACDCDNDEIIIFHDATQNLEISYNDSIPTLVYMNGIENWFGSETVTFYVSDQTGRLTDSDDVVINVAPVNDPPMIDVPDTGFTFAEDSIFEVDFMPYISDIDSDSLIIIVSEGEHIQAVIDNYQVTFIVDQNWFGSEQHTFTVGDGEFYASDTAPVNVTPVNDDPILSLPAVFNTDEDMPLAVDFTEYISDIDNPMTDISINLIGNYPDVDVDINVMMVTFTPVPDFNGTVNIGFLVDDSVGGSASDYVDLIVSPVNDAPSIELPDSFTFNEDESLQIDFEPYVNDIDNDVLTLSSLNPENINVAIDEFMVTFTADLNWNGTESVTFIISDEQGRATDSDDVDLIVIPVNDAPVIDLPAEFRFDEDNLHERDFTSYISDIDTPLDELALQVSGDTNIDVNIDGFDVILSATENWSGQELLTFTVYETTMRLQDSDDVTVIVNPINDPPVIQLPVSVNVNEGGSVILDMTDFVSDIDNDYSELTLEADSTEYVTIQIDGFDVTLSALTDWNGTEIVDFTVQDTAASVSDNMRVNIIPVNDPPDIDLPDEFLLQEDIPRILDFSMYVSDVDEDDLSLYVSGNENIQVEINGLNVSIIGNENWNGQEILYFTVDDNVTRLTDTDSTMIIVQPINDAPQITLPSQFDIQEDLPFTVDFADYIVDVDQDSLLLTVSGNNNIQVTIDSLSVTFQGNENWYGQEILRFNVQDPDSLFDMDNVIIHVEPVNDSPVIDLPDQISLQEDEIQQIDFSDYVSDVDQDILSLIAEGNTNIQVVVSGLIVSLYGDENWFGQEMLYFTVDDNIDRLTASDSVLVVVQPVNDPPVLTLPDSVIVNEGGSFDLDLATFIVDIDNDLSELTVSSPGTEHLQIDVNGVIVTITAFSDWYGIENLQITVADLEFNTTDFIQVNIMPTNDFPVIDLPDTLTTLEDVPLTIDVGEYASDVDEDQLTLTISGNTEINVDIDGLAVTLYGNTNWYGQEMLHFTIDDNINRLTATDSALIVVQPVNDPPVINLPASIIAVQDTLETFDFSEFIFDVEGDPLTLTYTGNDFIDSIYVDGLTITIIDSTWMTTENVLFEVTDGEYTSSDVVNITLIPTGEVPGTGDIVITLPNIDELEPGEDFEFPVDVNILLEAWEIYGFNFNLLFDPSILEFLGWNFENTIVDSSRFEIRDTSVSYLQESPIYGTGSLINIEFKYISTEYEQDVVELDEFEFTAPEPVIPIVFDGVVNNDYPTLALPLANQALQEDFANVEVNLRDFFFDNTPNSILEFSVSSASQDFAVAIDQNMMNIVSIQDRYTDQTIPVTVVCWDKFLYSVRDTFLVTVDPVNDPPVIVGLEDFQLEPDQQLPVDFNDYIFDVDNDVLSDVTIEILNLTSPLDPDIDLVYNPGPLDKSATFTAPHNWTGFNNYQIIAYDLVDSDTTGFNVNVVYTGSNDIHCYPNPMTTDLGTRFVINSTTNISNVAIDIYDFSGKKVCSQTFQARGANEITWMGYTNGWNGSKNGTKLARGVYFARVVGKDDYGEIALEKVIKVAIKE